MSTTKKEISREIVPCLVEDLRDLPDGTKITLEELITDSFYSGEVFSDEALAFLRKRLYSLVKREQIVLEKQDDGSFIVHNADAKYICPHCGSKNTARILYGYPAFSPQLERKLDEGRIRLGGCIVTDFDPDRHCNECGRDFSTVPSVWDLLRNEPGDEGPGE